MRSISLSYIFEKAEGFVARLKLAVYSADTILLPPFTSRVIKHVVSVEPELSFLLRLYEERGSFRRVTFSPLYANGKPLFKVSGREGVLTLRPGSTYYGSITIVSRDFSLVDRLASFSGGRVRTSYGVLNVEPVELSFERLKTLSLGIDRYFRVRFLTPTILTTKLMTPPPMGGRRVIAKAPERHRLLPTPSYVMASAARLWIALALNDDPRGSWLPYKIGRMADVLVAEVDQAVRCVTAIYGGSGKGRYRLVRGVVGWVVYEVLSPKIRVFVDRMLALADRMGLGRSRSVGFGQVKVSPLKEGFGERDERQGEDAAPPREQTSPRQESL